MSDEARCGCGSCAAMRIYGVAMTCCPNKLSHAAICICGGASRSPDSAPAREASEPLTPQQVATMVRVYDLDKIAGEYDENAPPNSDFLAASTIQRLIASHEALRARLVSLEHEIGEARKERDALRKYAQHDWDCASNMYAGLTFDPARLRCSCGLSSLPRTTE